jgi:NADPH2:quinone reductase
LQWHEGPTPQPGPGEVLIQVWAAGINRPDVAQRKGHYPAPPGVSPDIPGLEVAGTIVSTGPGCVRWKPGDRVCALIGGGGYAEYCTAPEGQCLPVPANLSFVDAASLPETLFTVWSNVFQRGRLQPGETLLVHGGSSGIGVAAIQLAKAKGCKVFVTAGSEVKCSFCRDLGADLAINYKVASFREECRKATSGRGVDVILDMVGGDYTPDNLEVLAEEGRLVLINFMKGDETTIRLSQVMRKRLTITGSTLRARSIEFKSALAAQLEQQVWPWLSAGKIKAVVYQTFPAQRAADAHALMETGSHLGKIVLTFNA